MNKSSKLYKLGDQLDKSGKAMSAGGSKMTKKVTFPIILFILGAVTFPVGILLWVLAFFLLAA